MLDDDTNADTRAGYAGAKRKAKRMAKATVVQEDGYVLHKYPDYETYKTVQVEGNKAKLGKQFVRESHVRRLAEDLNAQGHKVAFGLCHGTRRGLEQAWFNAHLKGKTRVIGTEISDTATQFPDTVQWDFHDPNPEWSGKADLIYSNSWDHAYDPVKAFGNWIGCLKPGGVMILDHTEGHAPRAASALDPFGITLDALTAMLNDNFSEYGAVEEVKDCTDNPEYRAFAVIFRRKA